MYFIKKLQKMFIVALSISLVAIVMIVGCQKSNHLATEKENDDGLYIVTSISILADMAKNIVGDMGTVEYIVPVGDNPEDYELIPSDLSKINKADLFFVNGLGLEETIVQMLNTITSSKIKYVSDGIPTIPLVGSSDPDPHGWFDVMIVTMYVENMYQAISDLDPINAEKYRANTDAYIAELTILDHYIKEAVRIIPEENRVIVISENAMKYFGDAYGFQTEGIWELNSHEEGTPQQIARVIDLVYEKNLPALFTETTVDSRYMDMISRETGVPIAGSLYTDALGAPGTAGDTYIKMMKRNVELLIEGLQ